MGGETALALPFSLKYRTNEYLIHVHHLHHSLLSYENYFHWLIQCQQLGQSPRKVIKFINN